MVKVDSGDLERGKTPATLKELEDSRPKKRINELLMTIAAGGEGEIVGEESVCVNFRYLLNPAEVLGGVGERKGKVKEVVFKRNRLVGEANKQTAVIDDDEPTLSFPCDLLIRSVGYKCEPISPVPFDSRKHTIPHQNGRAVEINEIVNTPTYLPIPGLYVSGWLKRGAVGIIGTNINDAKETVSSLLEDVQKGILVNFDESLNEYDPFLSAFNHAGSNSFIQWKEYLKIENLEIERGKSFSPIKVRDKLLSLKDMVDIAKNK
jgi:NADPH-dependent glutamate synthase beta subunit-like oxidoreductase